MNGGNVPTHTTIMADPSPTTTAAAPTAHQKYDLLPKMMLNLDRHLIFPLIEHMESQGLLPQDVIVKAKYDLLKHTNMTDYVGSLWRDLHGEEEIPEEFAAKREKVLNELAELEEGSRRVTQLLEDQEVVAQLRADKAANMKFLEEKHEVGEFAGGLWGREGRWLIEGMST